MSKLGLMVKGSALRTAEAVVAIIAGFVTLPIMLNQLGEDLYGFWVLAGSFTGLMYIFDLGFAAAVTRNVTHAIATADHRKANKVINSSLLIYTALFTLIVLIVIAVAFLYTPNLAGTISTNEFRIVMILLGLTVASEFPVKAFAGVATAHYRYDLLSIYRIILKFTSTVIVVTLLLSGYKVIAIAAVGLAFAIIGNVIFYVMAQVIYKEMELSRHYAERKTIAELFSYSSWAFLIDINQITKQRIDLFFIGGFISLSSVSIYYVSVRLVEYTSQLLFKMLNIALPLLTDHTAKGDHLKFRDDLILFNRLNCYCAAIATSAFILLGEPILFYWMGSDFDYQTAYHILLVLLAGRMSALAANAFNTGLLATSQHKLVAKISFLETGLSGFLLTVGLGIYDKGLLFAAYAISAPLIVGRILVLPALAARTMALAHIHRLMLQSFRPLLLIPLAYAVDSAINSSSPEISWNLAGAIAAGAVIAALFVSFDISPRERHLVRRMSPRLLRKIHA